MSFQAEEEITEQVRTVTVGGTSFEVEEGIVDDTYSIPVSSGSFKPVIVVTHGGGVQTPKKYQHLAGAKYDSETKICTVTVIGSEDASVRRVMDAVKKRLVGFEPTNCGEVTLALYATLGGRSTLGSPTRYTSVQTFTYMSNSDMIN